MINSFAIHALMMSVCIMYMHAGGKWQACSTSAVLNIYGGRYEIEIASEFEVLLEQAVFFKF